LSSYIAGDLLYYASGTTLTRLGIGASGRWLGSSGTAPQWNAPAALTKTDDTNVTLTLGGNASTALLNAASLTLGWTGTLAVSRGGTGTATAFTAGSVVFAGASGVYSQDNANFFWDDTNNRLGLGTTGPSYPLQITRSGVAAYLANTDGSGTLLSGVNGAGLGVYGTFSNTAVAFFSNSAERARIFTSGGVSIGNTIDPGATNLSVTGNIGVNVATAAVPIDIYNATTASVRVQGDSTANMQVARNSTDTASPTFLLRKGRGTIASPLAVASGDVMGQFIFQAFGGTNNRNLAAVTGTVETYTSDTNISSNLRFSTTPTGTTTASERVRIDAAGYTQYISNNILPYQGAPTSKAAAATLTGAELVTGILNTTGTTYTITLPTGANIEGALTWVANNVSLDWWVINTASGTITIAANGNTTLGALTVATGTSAYFRIRRTAANTFTVYRLS
jgi:hypothetical protein